MNLGKILSACGIILFLLGVIILIFEKIFPFGRLPGDIFFERGSIKVYIPLGTALLLSIVLTIFLNLIIFILRR